MQKSNQHTRLENKTVTKKPYEKPAIVYRAPLEALAAVCPPPSQGGTGKNSIGQPGCNSTFS